MLKTLALALLLATDALAQVQPDPMAVPSRPQKPFTRAEEILQGAPPKDLSLGLKGIDVSHYQGYIQWPLAARDPQVGYVYVKATESATWVDDTYERNVREARRAKIKVGAYHFFSPTTAPQEQLANMTAVVKKRDMDLVPLIDVEKVGKAGSANLCHRLRTFLKGVERHYGVRPMIYTGYNFYRKHLAGHFNEYKFMIASYAEERPDFEALDATVLIWQYSAKGRVGGVRGNCDCSAFINGHTLREILINP